MGWKGYTSGVLYLRLSGQFQACFFFYEKTIFILLEVFVLAKICCLCCLLWVFLVGFCLWCIFALRKSFRKKKNKQVWNFPDNLKINTTRISQKPSAYYFYMETKILVDFSVWIIIPYYKTSCRSLSSLSKFLDLSVQWFWIEQMG